MVWLVLLFGLAPTLLLVLMALARLEQRLDE